LTVEPASEYVDHGCEVLNQLLLGCEILLTLSGKFDSILLEYPLEEVKAESAQSVLVGNHNVRDLAAAASPQKPFETGPFEVETGADVRDDLDVLVLVLEVGNLSLQIVLLLGRGHSAVGDSHFRFPCSSTGSGTVFSSADGTDIVEARVCPGDADHAELAVPDPCSKGESVDAEEETSCSGRNELWPSGGHFIQIIRLV
jgi:hypothetical protein